MTSQLRMVLTVLFVFLCSGVCAGFNLDSRFAVVKEGNTPGSLFGLSVAMHRQTVGRERYLLLVGAPEEKAESKLRANRTGDMYSCPITTDPKDCIRANLISSDTVDPEDVIEGMWLGVSVVSQGSQKGRVMACGHRYSRTMDNGVNLRMIGKCYIRGNDLRYNDSDSQWQYRQEVCSPNGNHFMEGMCNMGISATMTETEVIAGAPGCYNWQGNSYVVYRNPDDMFDTQIIKLQDMNTGNIYIGYSVGKDKAILSKDEDTVVAGAPRYNSKGSVVLMKVITAKDGSKELKDLNVTLEGEQVGSYFGNSIAIIDINNDGWKDLIVGAPFYFNRRSEEGGAVYVFMNENGSFKPKTNLMFTGPSDSGFGMAVSSIGDVNQDGFLDFAVGAPFHGSGRVCVWMGGKDGVSPKPNQVIEGKDVSNGGFKTFGYSISGGLDVDSNNYPDVVVGSLDDRVALLRARPVIHVKKTLTVTPSIVDPNNCESCIKVEVCFSYTLSTGKPNFKEDIIMKYTLEADVLHHTSQTRVRFAANNKDVYTGFISMTKQHCEAQTLEVIKFMRDKVTPVVFSLNASIFEPETSNGQQKELQNLNLFPVLSQGRSLTDKAEVNFQKECGADNKCESNLQISATFAKFPQDVLPVQDGHQVLQYDSSIKKLLLLVNVTNFPSPGRLAEDAHNTELNVSISSSLRYSAVRSEMSSVNCAPKDSFILCELGNPLATNQMVVFAIIFETTFISLDSQEITSTLQLSTLSIQDDLMPLTKVLLVDYTLQTSFQVIPSRVQTEFSGHVIGESAIKNTGEIGSPVEFKFVVNIDTPIRGNHVFYVDFNWPTEVANGKWLLYVEEITMTGTSELLCVPPGDIVNPRKYQVLKQTSSRRKRDENYVAHLEALSALNLKGARRKTDHLNCTSGTANCTTFSCYLHNMTTTATVTVRSRLWNSTMLEDYNKASLVFISGEATLKLKTDRTMIHLDNKANNVTFSVEVTPAIQDEVEYKVPQWIIIVSALAGVLLLALIVVLLWKCGFFRRANTREIYEAKSQKAEMRTQPSEKDRLTEDE
ncbi:hypothetical protein Q7C36_017152 [Tachysurus vachellii]|uniref:Uncharacterized protein n=1 Tax=Tachysurus vachellii TaxID=175792 RepID=A0AA88S677_TACVA|nr:hypothetical protein Q7C36_017152 [Tachysurus vachellii]